MKKKFKEHPKEEELEGLEDIEEENIYSEDGINQLIDDDEISGEELGFMFGYMEA